MACYQMRLAIETVLMSEETAITVPAIVTPEPTAEQEKKKIGRPRNRTGEMAKKVKPEQIDLAMTAYHGHEGLVAEHLGVKRSYIMYRIRKEDYLRLKWTGAGRRAMEQAEFINSTTSIIEKQINSAYTTLSSIQHMLLNQMKAIEKRIQQGEKARFSDLPEETKFRFALNDKGEPSEEAMLRENYLKLAEEFRKASETFVDTAHTNAKVAALRKATENKDKGRGRPDTPTSFGPKRAPVRSQPLAPVTNLTQINTDAVHIHPNGQAQDT